MDVQEELHSKWICPSDRHLSLRAKLNCGWSVRTSTTNCQSLLNDVTENEISHVKEVVVRSEKIENNEKIRIGAMVHQLEQIRDRCCGNGVTSCILCGEQFRRFVGTLPVTCMDCEKKVCNKCSVDVTIHLNKNAPVHHFSNLRWLCKVCSESRKLWKMSGAWFFRSLPRFMLPKKTDLASQKVNHHSFLSSSSQNFNLNPSFNYSHRESICIGRRRSSSSISSDDEL